MIYTKFASLKRRLGLFHIKEETYTSTSAYQLNVNIQNAVNTYLHHALPLCIILSDEHLYPWYYERFIQIYSEHQFYKREGGLIAKPEISYQLGINNPESLFGNGEWKERYVIDFLEPYLGNDVLQELRVSELYGADPDDILDFIIAKINLGYYVYINLDEYYLPNKNAYNKRHFIHPTLVYGYDNNKRILLAVGFEGVGSAALFTGITYNYTVFDAAYKHAKRYLASTIELNKSLVTLLKLKEFVGNYPFNIDNFMTSLRSYLFQGQGSSSYYLLRSKVLKRNSPIGEQADPADDVKFGIDVYDDLLAALDGISKGKNLIDYPMIHLLYEHKKGIMERLNFVCARYGLSSELSGFIENYQKIVKQTHTIRFKALEFKSSGRLSLVTEMLELISITKKVEQELLMRIYDLIANLVQNRQSRTATGI